jgi:hypothetical protein
VKVWTAIPPEQLRDIAHELGMRIHADHAERGIRKDGRAWNFRLALDSSEKKDGYSRYQRTSVSYFGAGRKVAAVCWHGYRDYMIEVFNRDPNARIKTAFADYKGIESFRELYPATGHKNIGPPIAPVMMAHACACSHSGWIVDLSIYPDSSRFQIKQSVIKSCPFYIMVPEHYRADGSCKCDDPEHREYMKREWEYTDADFAGIS